MTTKTPYEYDPRDWAHVDEDGVISLNPTREGQEVVIVPVHPKSALAEMVREEVVE